MLSGLQLVPFQRYHLAQTLLWANDSDLGRLVDRVKPISEIEHEAWFVHLHENLHQVYFAVENQGSHIGNIWLYDIDWRHRKAELRVLLGQQQGQGFGTQAIDLLCNYGFEKLNLHRIYAYVLAINPRARRAFEKVGFELEGILKQDRWATDHYTDVFVLGRLRER